MEPCAFAHFSVDNIKDRSLREVLGNPLFRAYQKRQPFNSNHLVPCPIIDNPQALREIVAESGAHPTHPGAETVLQDPIASHLDEVSRRWAERAALIRRRMQETVAEREVAVAATAPCSEEDLEERALVGGGGDS